MKKTINGKVYNTETAKEIGSNWYSHARDINYWCETLYRKKDGEYFLYGEGGANTGYSKWVPGWNEWSSGWKIMPMTEVEAREWAEAKLEAEEYIAAFGEPEE